MRSRYLINNHGPDKNNLIKAFQFAMEIACEEKKDISMFISTLDYLDGIITDVFGKEFVKKIKKGDILLDNGIRINVLTDITVNKKQRNCIFLCIHTTGSAMNKINSFYEIEHEIYLPWYEKDIEDYSNRDYILIN